MFQRSLLKLLFIEQFPRPSCCSKTIVNSYHHHSHHHNHNRRSNDGRSIFQKRNKNKIFSIKNDSNNTGKCFFNTTTSNREQHMTTHLSQCPFHQQQDHNHHHNHHDHPIAYSSQQQKSTTIKAENSEKSYLSFEKIPKPNGLPLFGTLIDLIMAGGAEYLHHYCDKRHESLGPIYRERLGNVEAVFVADSKLVEQVYKHEGKYPQHMVPEPWIIYNQDKGIRRGLFFMEGEEWGVRRSILNKVFLKPDVINKYTPVFNQVVTDILDNWMDKITTKQQQQPEDQTLLIDGLEKELYNWSIESLGTMIFGRRLGCINKSNIKSSSSLSTSSSLSSKSSSSSSLPLSSSTTTSLPDIHEFVHCVQQIFVESANMQLIPPKLAHYLKLPVWKRFEKAAGKALDLAFQYVNENARQQQQQQDDNNMNGNGIIKQLMNSGDMELEEISRIIVDLFIAAADTTSHATQWALYLLSRHEHVQQRLYEEIQMVTNGEPINEKHLPHLPYVKGIIKESLRLYPVAPFLTRYLSDDLILGGYHVPKGQLVVISLFTTGRKEEYFDQPERFIPERWIRDPTTGKNQVNNNSFACLPFGLGVRSCIGRRVAEIQMQFFLSRIVQKFHIESTSEKEIDIKLRMITTPEKSIDLLLKPRNSPVQQQNYQRMSQ